MILYNWHTIFYLLKFEAFTEELIFDEGFKILNSFIKKKPNPRLT